MQTEESVPPFKLVYSGTTNIGRARQFNEDAVLLRPDLCVFAVADGAGGHNAGNVASSLAVTSLANYFERTEPDTLTKPELDGFGLLTGARRISSALHFANREIREIAAAGHKRTGMGSTVVALSFSRSARLAHVAHLGDSRGYRLRAGALEQLTDDHCFRQDILEAKPDISDDELRKLPLHTVTRGLGLEAGVRVSVRSIETAPGDTFLLCSDGLSGSVSRERIRDLLTWSASLEARVYALIDAANEAGGRDNIAVVLVACESVPSSVIDAPKPRTQGAGTLFPPPRPSNSPADFHMLSIADASKAPKR